MEDVQTTDLTASKRMAYSLESCSWRARDEKAENVIEREKAKFGDPKGAYKGALGASKSVLEDKESAQVASEVP